ncbi:hypothetical protein D3C81_634440 [compost metagenome]
MEPGCVVNPPLASNIGFQLIFSLTERLISFPTLLLDVGSSEEVGSLLGIVVGVAGVTTLLLSSFFRNLSAAKYTLGRTIKAIRIKIKALADFFNLYFFTPIHINSLII